MRFLGDWAFARYLHRRATKRSATICRRRLDGTLWAASSPQNFGLAMCGLYDGTSGWHLAKVRIWRGVPIVSRKTFWITGKPPGFDIVQRQDAFWMPPFAEAIESAKIRAETN
jgi:hypothetical protein